MSGATAIVLDDTPNQAVVRLAERRFPGVVLQGDSLKALYDDVAEAAGALRAADPVRASEEIEGVLQRLADLLQHYESVLASAGIEVPYQRIR
jgi:hypothetical protein